jgi:hypothetical protein
MALVMAGAMIFTAFTSAALLQPAAAAVGAAGTAGTPAGAGRATGVTRVQVDQSTVKIAGKLASGASTQGVQVAIYALDVSQDPSSYTSNTPIATVNPTPGGVFTATVPRFQGSTDLYDEKFLAVSQSSAGDSVLGTAVYPTNVKFAAVNDYPYPTTTSIKGVTISSMTDDTEQLGIQHADENVVLNALMRPGPGAPGTYLTFDSGGTTYYFNKAAVTSIDNQIRSMTHNGVVVSIIVLLTNTSLPLLFPGADTSQGTILAFNTKTAEGVRWVRAGFEFLASRYERADAEFGRADDFIVGNEIDAAWAWYNMGDQTLTDFTEYYDRALRMMYLAARKYYPNPRVYVSLENHWAQTADPTQPLRSYPGKDVLDALEATGKAEGDFPWAVAYHPYPENLFNPASWNDPDATDSFGSPFITFKNIQELPAYMQQPQFLFKGQQRHIILSEQGCNTPSDSVADQQLQAACYAYAYYKIFFAGGIDAFNYHRDIDHPLEGGLRLGLWSWDPNQPMLAGNNMPGSPKPIYNVVKYIDTSRSLEVTKFALPIIGISSWKQAIPNFDPSRLAVRPIAQQLNASSGQQPVNETVLASFADGTDGWRASDNTNAVEDLASSAPAPDTGLLRVHFDSGLSPISTDAFVWKSADVILANPLSACAQPHLDLDLRIPTPSAGQFKSGTTFEAQVRVYGPNGQMAEGTAPIDASGQWSPLSFDLSQFSGCDSVNRIKVLVHATSDDQWSGHFDLAQVGLSRALKPSQGS